MQGAQGQEGSPMVISHLPPKAPPIGSNDLHPFRSKARRKSNLHPGFKRKLGWIPEDDASVLERVAYPRLRLQVGVLLEWSAEAFLHNFVRPPGNRLPRLPYKKFTMSQQIARLVDVRSVGRKGLLDRRSAPETLPVSH